MAHWTQQTRVCFGLVGGHSKPRFVLGRIGHSKHGFLLGSYEYTANLGVFLACSRTQQTWDCFLAHSIAGHNKPGIVVGSQQVTTNLGLFLAHRTQQTWVSFRLVGGHSKPRFVLGRVGHSKHGFVLGTWQVTTNLGLFLAHSRTQRTLFLFGS